MSDLWQLFAEPLSYPFMQRALITALLVATVSAALSCFLVLKGWSLMGDAVSHAVLPGIVLAHFVALPVALGAFAAGLACAVLSGLLKANSRLKEDTAMGVVFSGMFGLGLVLFTKFDTGLDLHFILFGNVLGVTKGDLVQISIIAIVTLGVIAVKWRDMLVFCFDAQHARAIGLPVYLIHYGLLVLLAMCVVAALKAVGIILAIAMLIGPGATAFLMAQRFGWMMVMSVGSALVSAFAGVISSYHFDVAPGPLIVVYQTVLFCLAFTFAPGRGLFATARVQREAEQAQRRTREAV